MIFEPAERVVLPTRDLLSFIFDDPPYDQDQPVSGRSTMGLGIPQAHLPSYTLDLCRYSQ